MTTTERLTVRRGTRWIDDSHCWVVRRVEFGYVSVLYVMDTWAQAMAAADQYIDDRRSV